MHRIGTRALLLLAGSGLFWPQAHAQRRATGLTFNAEQFAAVPALPESGGEKALTLSLRADLSAYAPPAGDQGRVPACVAWATLYSAYGIQAAARSNVADPARARSLALSALFPYKQLRPECESGLNLHEAAAFLARHGDVPFPDLPANACETPIGEEHRRKAAQFRPVRDYLRLFGTTDVSDAQKIFLVKKSIDLLKAPVITGIQVWDNLSRLTEADDYYYPSRGRELLELHAVTVVGYDDGRGAFKLMNSWGPTWGQRGFFWMKYQEFAQTSVGGIILVLADPTNEISGDFGFQYLKPNASGEAIFEKTQPRHVSNGVYELNRKDWEVGQAFQLLTRNRRSGLYMCVFSLDAENVLNVHWPTNQKLVTYNPNLLGMNHGDLNPVANYDVTIPAKDRALYIEKPGTDRLVVLYSSKPLLDDLPRILERVRTTPGDILTRLRAALGSRLKTTGVSYQPSGMSFTARAGAGDTIPMILTIQSQP